MIRYLLAIVFCCGVVGFSTGRTFAEPQVAPESVPAYIDPLADPSASVGTIEKLWRSGAIPSALIVAGFMTLVVLRQRVPWFQQGWRAVWCSAAIGGFGMLMQSIESGQTPNASMVIVALTTTAALAMKPTPPALPVKANSGEIVVEVDASAMPPLTRRDL